MNLDKTKSLKEQKQEFVTRFTEAQNRAAGILFDLAVSDAKIMLTNPNATSINYTHSLVFVNDRAEISRSTIGGIKFSSLKNAQTFVCMMGEKLDDLDFAFDINPNEI